MTTHVACAECARPIRGMRTTDPLLGPLHEGCAGVVGWTLAQHAAQGCDLCVAWLETQWIGPTQPACAAHWADHEPVQAARQHGRRA